MAAPFLFVCSAAPAASGTDPATCPPESQAWVSAEQAFTPGDLGIDAAGITEVAGWGVGVVLLLWSIGFGVGAAVQVIRKV